VRRKQISRHSIPFHPVVSQCGRSTLQYDISSDNLYRHRRQQTKLRLSSVFDGAKYSAMSNCFHWLCNFSQETGVSAIRTRAVYYCFSNGTDIPRISVKQKPLDPQPLLDPHVALSCQLTPVTQSPGAKLISKLKT